jgi:hypothetical protein
VTIKEKKMRKLKVRVCANCGDKKEVVYYPTGKELCKSCAYDKFARETILKRYENHVHVKYTYICHSCDSVREFRTKRKSNFCTKCSRVWRYKKKHKIYFDFDTMSIINLSPKPKPKPIKMDIKRGKGRPKIDNKRIGNQPSKQAIERAKEMNRKHKEALKEKPKIVKQTVSEEELIAMFLLTNSPSVVVKNEPIPHAISPMESKDRLW